jgi:hypothetical protein
MMRSRMLTLTLLISWLLYAVAADANMVIRILLNEGNVTKSGLLCNTKDTALLENAIYQVSNKTNRHLQIAGEGHAQISRKVPYYPPYCKKNCAGYAPGTCLVANCIGFRRGLVRDGVHRNLHWSDDCASQMNVLNVALDSVEDFTLDCQSLVNGPRNMTCLTSAGCYADTLLTLKLGSNRTV